MTVAVLETDELEAMMRRVVEGVVKAHLRSEDPELLSTKQLSEVLGISEDMIRYYVRTKHDFPFVRVGRKKLRFRLADVLRYFEDHDLGAIAKLCGTSRSVVAVTLFRTRNRLKKELLTGSSSPFAGEAP